MKLIEYNKIVIWGHPLYSHTHSYVHDGYYHALKHLGFDVNWFHDKNFPIDFDFSNTFFITEGFADKNIPLNDTSCYIVWYCPDPSKYINAGVKRFIEARMPADNHKDHIHEYTLSDIDTIKIGPSSFLKKKTSKNIFINNNYVSYNIEDYDVVYINWATNLLPHMIDESDIYRERDNSIYYFGTISPDGVCENTSNWNPFILECQNNGISFYHSDPWKTPRSTDQVIEYTKRSYLGIDIRGPVHVRTNIVPCRPFKNVSYGHLGITNSLAVQKALDGNCVYNNNTAQLFHDGIANKKNFNLIKSGQKYVKENHTYINRVNSLLKIVNNEY